jgi:hypothetical protein
VAGIDESRRSVLLRSLALSPVDRCGGVVAAARLAAIGLYPFDA